MRQSANDFDFAKVGLREGFYAQSCFLCQQAAEKALKAVLYMRGARTVIGHSLSRLLGELVPVFPEFAAFRDLAQEAVAGTEGLLAEVRALLPPAPTVPEASEVSADASRSGDQ